MENRKNRKTYSVCPVCLRRIPAVRIHSETGVRLEKNCPEHGAFSAVIWRNRIPWEDWGGDADPVGEEECLQCGNCPGLCRDHRRSTCCTLLEVTGRCNMNCTFCFAGDIRDTDPSTDQVKAWISDLTIPGKTFLQLSGGEPTIRDDLPEIVVYAARCGCKYIQLNSNGIRLAEDMEYVQELADAGLSFVFLQFDGVSDDVYVKLRKRPLLEIKEKAIENCGRCGIGVALVPVIVPGINVNQIGDIIRFGIRHSPVVRGVHFQPVSYFGRIPALPRDEDRLTLDQLIEETVKQSRGLIKEESLSPSCCDHPMCGFHGDFMVLPDRSLMSLTAKKTGTGCCGPKDADMDPAEKNREFIGRRWKRESAANYCMEESWAGDSQAGGPGSVGGPGQKEWDLSDMDTFLDRVKCFGFTLTSMAFQDAGNLDLERLRRCSLHVYRDGQWIPFCANYLTGYPSAQRNTV